MNPDTENQQRSPRSSAIDQLAQEELQAGTYFRVVCSHCSGKGWVDTAKTERCPDPVAAPPSAEQFMRERYTRNIPHATPEMLDKYIGGVKGWLGVMEDYASHVQEGHSSASMAEPRDMARCPYCNSDHAPTPLCDCGHPKRHHGRNEHQAQSMSCWVPLCTCGVFQEAVPRKAEPSPFASRNWRMWDEMVKTAQEQARVALYAAASAREALEDIEALATKPADADFHDELQQLETIRVRAAEVLS